MTDRRPTTEGDRELFPCPCCGYIVFSGRPGSHDFCPVCHWEDDLVQLRWPSYAGGANKDSLLTRQRRFLREGRGSPEYAREPGWRPADPGRGDVEPLDTDPSPWPDDRTVLYWWRPAYWRRLRHRLAAYRREIA